MRIRAFRNCYAKIGIFANNNKAPFYDYSFQSSSSGTR